MASNALILTDGKPGHENQSIALCRRLGLAWEKATVSYPHKLAKALSYLLDRLGILTPSLFRMDLPTADANRFDLIVSAGSTTFYPNKVLAKKTGAKNIAILYPRGYRPDFTAILCPAYDHPPSQRNVIPLPINLCAADSGFFERQAKDFQSLHQQNRPAVGFIIGGPNAVSTLNPDKLKTQLERAFAATDGCERWVTTSRRTPAAIEALVESMPFDYCLISSRDPANPIPAFIQLCDRLFVTSDSSSMISECVSFGTAAVEILVSQPLRSPNKFEQLVHSLEERGAVHCFTGTLGQAREKMDLTGLLCARLHPLLHGENQGEPRRQPKRIS